MIKTPYLYLNRGDKPLFGSKLFKTLETAQKRAPISQWMAFITGLTTKGIKESEIRDTSILKYLSMQNADTLLAKEDLLKWLKSATPTVKEINLSKHQYVEYSQPRNPQDKYEELLYVLNSERDNIDDRLEEIRFELEELDFDMTLLAQDPMLAERLYKEQQELLAGRSRASVGTFGHWSSAKDPTTGENVANLLAHSRISVRDDLYFVEEIQSDWAQRGRRKAVFSHIEKLRAIAPHIDGNMHGDIISYLRANRGKLNAGASLDIHGYSISLDELLVDKLGDKLEEYIKTAMSLPEWTKEIPAGPWVTNTELWAGLIMRRQIQRAASMPEIKRLAWIRAGMRNGGGGDRNYDDMDDFYLKIMPKITDKIISGTGEKAVFMKVNLAEREFEVPGIQITDKVREKMLQTQPLYSRDVLPFKQYELSTSDHAAFNRMLHKSHEMLGSGISVRLAKNILDDAMKPVAARITGNLIEVSTSAKNPARALAHEGWHYAYDNLLSHDDKHAVDESFRPGARLNKEVRKTLAYLNANPDAIAQCDDPIEAAAHGWSLWLEGELFLNAEEKLAVAEEYESQTFPGMEGVVAKIFRKVEKSFLDLGKWVRRICGETPEQQAQSRTETVFHALYEGLLREGHEGNNRNKNEQDEHYDDEDSVVQQTSNCGGYRQRMGTCG